MFMHTNSAPGIVLVARDTATKETKYECSIFYFIFTPLTDSRCAMTNECPYYRASVASASLGNIFRGKTAA